MDVHIGKIIKERARKLRIGPTELGKLINTSKQNVYGIFQRKYVDTRLLWNLSIALELDLFEYFSKELRDHHPVIKMGADDSAELGIDKSLSGEIKRLKQEIKYLKRLNQLLEEKDRSGKG